MADIEIRTFESADADAFRALNEEWISHYFVLEPRDHETLGHPLEHIIAPGGCILMAWRGSEAVGCCALIPFAPGVYELGKMAVVPELRGQGIGRLILEAAIEKARALGAASLFLGSNRRLKNALHLYESYGFRQLEPREIPPLPYNRADVFMSLTL